MGEITHTATTATATRRCAIQLIGVAAEMKTMRDPTPSRSRTELAVQNGDDTRARSP